MLHETLLKDGYLFNKTNKEVVTELRLGDDVIINKEISEKDIFLGTKEEAESFGLIFNNENQL